MSARMERERRAIRAQQERSVADVERQLDGPMLHIEVGDRLISREAAWACTQAIRTAWKLGLRYDGQERDENGLWWARVESQPSGEVRRVRLGNFPQSLDGGLAAYRAHVSKETPRTVTTREAEHEQRKQEAVRTLALLRERGLAALDDERVRESVSLSLSIVGRMARVLEEHPE